MEEEKKVKTFKNNVPLHFDEFKIPKPLRETFMNLLNEILSYFNEKYLYRRDFPVFKDSNYLDQIATEAMSEDYTEFLKHDVCFVFSYISIVYVKHLFEEVRKKKILLEGEN